jgi:Rod binding domain-containing protein
VTPSVSPLGGSPPASPRGLPVVADTALPADVRRGTAKDKEHYKAALGFEQMLVGQLVQSMVGDDKDSPLAQGPYASTLQTSLSDALTADGGLGLARQIYKEMGQ